MRWRQAPVRDVPAARATAQRSVAPSATTRAARGEDSATAARDVSPSLYGTESAYERMNVLYTYSILRFGSLTRGSQQRGRRWRGVTALQPVPHGELAEHSAPVRTRGGRCGDTTRGLQAETVHARLDCCHHVAALLTGVGPVPAIKAWRQTWRGKAWLHVAAKWCTRSGRAMARGASGQCVTIAATWRARECARRGGVRANVYWSHECVCRVERQCRW